MARLVCLAWQTICRAQAAVGIVVEPVPERLRNPAEADSQEKGHSQEPQEKEDSDHRSESPVFAEDEVACQAGQHIRRDVSDNAGSEHPENHADTQPSEERPMDVPSHLREHHRDDDTSHKADQQGCRNAMAASQRKAGRRPLVTEPEPRAGHADEGNNKAEAGLVEGVFHCLYSDCWWE